MRTRSRVVWDGRQTRMAWSAIYWRCDRKVILSGSRTQESLWFEWREGLYRAAGIKVILSKSVCMMDLGYPNLCYRHQAHCQCSWCHSTGQKPTRITLCFSCLQHARKLFRKNQLEQIRYVHGVYELKGLQWGLNTPIKAVYTVPCSAIHYGDTIAETSHTVLS